MEKKILAKKASNGYAIAELIGMIISIIVVILGFLELKEKPQLIIFIILFIPCSIIFGFLGINALKNPEIMLYYDDEGIYLNYKNNLFIPFKEMVSVKAKHSRNRYHVFEFGHLVLTLRNKNIKIGVLDDIDNVFFIIQTNINKVKN